MKENIEVQELAVELSPCYMQPFFRFLLVTNFKTIYYEIQKRKRRRTN